MPNPLHLLLGVAVLGLGACAQPTVPTPSTTESSGGNVSRYELQQVAETALEKAILRRLNIERKSNGLATLTFSLDMRRLAREHSRDMVTRGYFHHTDLDGKEPYARMLASGIPFRSFGETISHRPVGGNTPDEAIDDWLRHPYGKGYMLSPNFTEAGVGVYQGGRYYYVTVEYRRP